MILVIIFFIKKFCLFVILVCYCSNLFYIHVFPYLYMLSFLLFLCLHLSFYHSAYISLLHSLFSFHFLSPYLNLIRQCFLLHFISPDIKLSIYIFCKSIISNNLLSYAMSFLVCNFLISLYFVMEVSKIN